MPADRSSYNQHNFQTARGSLLVPYPFAEEAFRWSNSHAPTNDFSTSGLSDFFIAHRRVARHRLCHGMTFSDLSFYPFASSFIVLGLISLLLLTFTLWT